MIKIGFKKKIAENCDQIIGPITFFAKKLTVA
jgi:hypothetical protein